LVVVGLASLTALFYLAAIHSFAGDSDGATVVLEGQSMAAGHLTLGTWALSVDSFWTVDALFNAVGVFIVGLKMMLLYLVPAFIAALVVLMGVVIARDGRRGAASVAAATTVVALLGLPSHYLSYFFLRGPLHVGTTLWCLVAFFALRRGRLGVGWFVAVVFLAAGLLGDLQTVALGIVPVLLAGIVAMLRTRNWRAGAPMIGAAAASVLLAVALRKLAELIGTFAIGKIQASASPSQMLTNLRNLAPSGAHMLGVGIGSVETGGGPGWLGAVHVVGVFVVLSALVYFAGRLFVGIVKGKDRAQRTGASGTKDTPVAWRLDDLLLIACFGGMVVFVVLSSSSTFEFDRYLTSSVIFASILAARLVGRLTANVDSYRLLACGGVVSLAVTASFATGLVIYVRAPDPPQPVTQLARFLEAHRLDHGIGDYWSASITTVTTDGTVTIRPVTVDRSGRIVRYKRQSSATWYAGQSFAFLVYNTAVPDAIDTSIASGTFGPPKQLYIVGTYRVLVWSPHIAISAAGFDPG
jgi:hypothetical protein